LFSCCIPRQRASFFRDLRRQLRAMRFRFETVEDCCTSLRGGSRCARTTTIILIEAGPEHLLEILVGRRSFVSKRSPSRPLAGDTLLREREGGYSGAVRSLGWRKVQLVSRRHLIDGRPQSFRSHLAKRRCESNFVQL
jgi:hypothetical protein